MTGPTIRRRSTPSRTCSTSLRRPWIRRRTTSGWGTFVQSGFAKRLTPQTGHFGTRAWATWRLSAPTHADPTQLLAAARTLALDAWDASGNADFKTLAAWIEAL